MFHFITKEFSERPEGNDLLPILQEQQSFRSFFSFAFTPVALNQWECWCLACHWHWGQHDQSCEFGPFHFLSSLSHSRPAPLEDQRSKTSLKLPTPNSTHLIPNVAKRDREAVNSPVALHSCLTSSSELCVTHNLTRVLTTVRKIS